jgi:hypothetical protein
MHGLELDAVDVRHVLDREVDLMCQKCNVGTLRR